MLSTEKLQEISMAFFKSLPEGTPVKLTYMIPDPDGADVEPGFMVLLALADGSEDFRRFDEIVRRGTEVLKAERRQKGAGLIGNSSDSHHEVVTTEAVKVETPYQRFERLLAEAWQMGFDSSTAQNNGEFPGDLGTQCADDIQKLLPDPGEQRAWGYLFEHGYANGETELAVKPADNWPGVL